MADFNEKVKTFLNTNDSTSEFDKADIDANKGLSILSYLWLLLLVPLLCTNGSKFARYHANQGITLAIVATVGSVIFGVLGMIPFIGILFSIIGALYGLACLLLALIGIINAVNGEAKELPLIGKYTFLK